MASNAPAIVKDTSRLLLELEKSIARFPRAHRYPPSVGADLRIAAIDATLTAQTAFRASRSLERQAELVKKLSDLIDRIKLQWQIAYRLQCVSFARFEESARLLEAIGKQCGGWKKEIDKRLMGQNSAAPGQQKRAPILSTCAASVEACR